MLAPFLTLATSNRALATAATASRDSALVPTGNLGFSKDRGRIAAPRGVLRLFSVGLGLILCFTLIEGGWDGTGLRPRRHSLSTAFRHRRKSRPHPEACARRPRGTRAASTPRWLAGG